MNFDCFDYDWTWEEMMAEWRSYLRERCSKVVKRILQGKRLPVNRNRRKTIRIIQLKRKLIKTF